MKARRKELPAAGLPVRATVLVVEDEHDLLELLRYNLSRDGYRVVCAESGEKALRMVRSDPPDLVVLDLMLPGMDGLEVCRAIKADAELSALPVIMLTARTQETDVVAGLELGADDYVTKPFSPRVLLARVKAMLRRRRAKDAPSGMAAEEEGSSVQVRELAIDAQRHEVTVGGEKIDLTATEFRLLHLLASRPGRVFTRAQIIQGIHGKFTAVTDRSVDVQVVMLRRKLGATGEEIETVRGVGYRFRD